MEYACIFLKMPNFHLHVLALALCCAVQILPVLWAAASRRRWLFRSLAVWSPVALFAPIGAYELVWLFTLTAVLIFAFFWAIRRWRDAGAWNSCDSSPAEPKARRRFGLIDLFSLTLLVGLWLIVLMPAVRSYRPDNWIGFIVSAVGLAVVGCIAYLDGIFARRWQAWVLLCHLIPVISAAIAATGDPTRMLAFIGVGVAWTSDFILMSYAISIFALVLMLVIALAAKAASIGQSRWKHVISGGLLAAGFVAAAIPLTSIYVQLLGRPAINSVPRFETPVSHYSRILEISQQTVAINPANVSMGDLRKSNPKSAVPQQIVQLYSEVLPLLEAPNAIDYDPQTDANLDCWRTFLPKVQATRHLARCFAAESEAAQKSGNITTAADYAIANLRLGVMHRRGGLVIHDLVGVAIEGIGCNQFYALKDDLSPDISRRFLDALQTSFNEVESPETLQARDRHFEEKVGTWRDRFERLLNEWFSTPDGQYVGNAGVRMRGDLRKSLLQTHLAIGVYQHDHGRLPETLDNLVPDYLPEIPRDPFSNNQPLIYRLVNESFALYSVWENGKDDGGTAGNVSYPDQFKPGKQWLDADLESLFDNGS